MTQQEKQAIIDSIHVNAENFEYIAKTGRINGTLHGELCRIINLLSDLRIPSERPNVKDYFAATETLGAIHNEIVEAPRLYAYMQALDAYIDSLEAKPSEPKTNVCEAVEELSKRIKAILDTTFTNSADFSRVSTEIASLMQPDKELLDEMYEALIIARDRIGVSAGYPREIAIAISNYEKQSK